MSISDEVKVPITQYVTLTSAQMEQLVEAVLARLQAATIEIQETQAIKDLTTAVNELNETVTSLTQKRCILLEDE